MEGQDGALSGITAENGGNVYGGNGFEKDRRGAAYHTEMDIAGSAYAPETGTWDGKTVPVAACTCCKGGTHDGRRRGGQTVKDCP